MKKMRLNLLLIIVLITMSLQAQDTKGLWSLVMTKTENNGLQRWKTRASFPEEEIKSDWKDGYEITQLSYLNGLWTLVTSKTNFYEQSWRTRNTVDTAMETFNEINAAGKKITSLEYGNGQWIIVGSKGTDYMKQEVQKHYLDFPYEYIQTKLSQGYFLSDIAFDSTYWITVFSMDSGTHSQFYFSSNEFPEKEIKNYWDKEYRINKLKFLNNKWYVFMVKNPKYGQQSWRTRYIFPEKEIKELWGEGYFITGIHHNPNYKTPKQEQTLVGAWKEVGIDNKMIFGSDGYLKLEYWDYDDLSYEENWVTMGGKDYKDPFGFEFDFKYEVNDYANPKRFDFVISSKDGELARSKYIYKFEGEKLIVKSPNEGVTIPATHFDIEDGYVISTLERVQ